MINDRDLIFPRRDSIGLALMSSGARVRILAPRLPACRLRRLPVAGVNRRAGHGRLLSASAARALPSRVKRGRPLWLTWAAAGIGSAGRWDQCLSRQRLWNRENTKLRRNNPPVKYIRRRRNGLTGQVIQTPLYQTSSAWSMDEGSTEMFCSVYDFAPGVTKFYITWEGSFTIS